MKLLFDVFLQVQQLFPHIPISLILEDLRISRSVEITIENVLDGQLVAPAMFREPEVLQASTNSVQAVGGSSQNWEQLSTDNGDM